MQLLYPSHNTKDIMILQNKLTVVVSFLKYILHSLPVDVSIHIFVFFAPDRENINSINSNDISKDAFRNYQIRTHYVDKMVKHNSNNTSISIVRKVSHMSITWSVAILHC